MLSEDTDEVLFSSQPNLYSCSICGREDNFNGYRKSNPALLQTMKQYHICYQCAYWIDIANNPPLNTEVIGNILYVANPFVHRPYNVTKGSFGKEFYIRHFDESLVRTNNLWKIGTIPSFCKDKFTETGNFLSLMVYQKLSSDRHKCNAKGCWDRYHCLRYDLANEKDGPFNTVPAKHRIGDEHCPSFINLNELKTK